MGFQWWGLFWPGDYHGWKLSCHKTLNTMNICFHVNILARVNKTPVVKIIASNCCIVNERLDNCYVIFQTEFRLKINFLRKSTFCRLCRYSLSLITFIMWYRRYRRPLPPASAIEYLKKNHKEWNLRGSGHWVCVPTVSSWQVDDVLWTFVNISNLPAPSCSFWKKQHVHWW